MKRNLYKKIVALVGISAFLATSQLYAQTNYGESLQEWYKGRSQQVVTQLIDSTVVQGLARSLNVSVSDLANHAEINLYKKQDADSSAVTTRIESASEEYSSQIKNEAAELVEVAQLQKFDSYIISTTSDNNDELEQLVEDTINERIDQLSSIEEVVSSN